MAKRLVFAAFVTALICLVLASPASAGLASATREHAATVLSENELEIAITPSGCGMFGQVIETLPPGFTYLGCSPDYIGVEKSGSTVKFTFAGSESFTYRVKAPSVTTTRSYTFRGVLKDEDKVEYPMPETVVAVKPIAPVTYRLTILVQGKGSTSPAPSITHVYETGEEVEITAIPTQGWQFQGWIGEVADPSALSTIVLMDKDQTIIANFSEVTATVYGLGVICKPREGGEVVVNPVAPFNQYQAGAEVTLRAIPSDGYSFSGWEGDVSGSEELITLTMDTSKTVIARFAPLSVLAALGRSDSLILSPLAITPAEARPGEDVHVLLSITNVSAKDASYQAFLFVNGLLEDARLVPVPAYTSQNVIFSLSKSTPGIYSVSIGDKQAQFVVKKGGMFKRGWTAGSLVAVMIAAVLGVALAIVLLRGKTLV